MKVKVDNSSWVEIGDIDSSIAELFGDVEKTVDLTEYTNIYVKLHKDTDCVTAITRECLTECNNSKFDIGEGIDNYILASLAWVESLDDKHTELREIYKLDRMINWYSFGALISNRFVIDTTEYKMYTKLTDELSEYVLVSNVETGRGQFMKVNDLRPHLIMTLSMM